MLNKNKRILIITYSYAPILSPRAFRWTSLAEHWSAKGFTVHVLCAWKPGLSQTEVIRGVHVFRRGKNFFETFRSHIKQSKSINDGQLNKTKPVTVNVNVVSLLKKVHNYTWKKLYWPDFASFWYFPTFKKARHLMESHYYDTLITVSHPFTCHLVGLSLKKKFSSLCWLADIGDPFSYAKKMPLNNQLLYGNLNSRVELKVFQKASHVTVTNHNAQVRYENTFGRHMTSHMSVIGPLVWRPSFLSSQSPVLRKTMHFQIDLVFTGNLINPVRRPGMFFQWIKDIILTWKKLNADNCPLVFHFFGDCSHELSHYFTADKDINTHLEFYGKVDRNNARAAIDEAHIAINCGNITDYQLPSKVFDYMAAGKPLINLIFNTSDPSVEALNGYSPCLNFFINSTPLSEVINFINNVSNGRSISYCQRSLEVIENYGVDSISRQYMRLFQ